MPRRLRFTREGRVFVLATLGVGAAAVNTGNNLLYLVLGLLLSLIVLSGILSEAVLRDVRVSRRLPKRAFRGSPALIELALENTKTLVPSLSVELEDEIEVDGVPIEQGKYRCYFLKVEPGAEERASYAYTPQKRGLQRMRAVRVRTRFPFGLFDKWRTIPLEEDLVVFAQLAPYAPPSFALGMRGADAPSAVKGAGQEVDGVREYVSGDEARAIHWRRSATLDRIVVRDRRRDAARVVVILIDELRPEGADDGWDARYERMLSEAATCASRVLERGGSVEVVARGGRSPVVPAGQPPDAAWRFLALLDPLTGEAPELPRARGAVVRFTVPGVSSFARGAA
ncbi:MAG: DUF58 domain-containing protein [Sandaracinaceae bacterium]